jgi:hypothetical protein
MPDNRPGPDVEYKSDAVKKLDAFFSGNARAENRRYARKILKDSALPTLAAVAEKAKDKMSLPDQQSKHFRDHWFNVGGAQVEQEMRRGYEDAMNRAEPGNLPIETSWMWGSQIKRFEILVSTEPQRVKVLVRIPEDVYKAAYEGL